ncbi:helix-turn-helix domain-containing protein [Kitasatospora sp. NPDC059327]|uniref:AraC family transcriptional regulator n=1 Tax=Kitasatospora sp. NPDC059327 TaxID=3346803 RepID=UPI0036C623C3
MPDSTSTAHYRTPPDAVRALGLAVTGVGRIVGQTSTRVLRTLSGYAGVLVTAGSGCLELHGRPGTHPVGPGSFFWLPPGVPHSYGPTGGSWDEYWILCEGPATARYEDLGYLGGAPVAARPADPGGVRALFVRLLEELARPESLAGHVMASATAHTLIGLVGTGRDEPPASAPTRGDTGHRDIGHRAVDLLARTDGPVRIGAVARELAVSRDTLATVVRRLTGSTPTEYLMRLRLDRAKVLLAGTDRPVAHIAREVGYPDPAYFTRVFTRYVGDPPTVFRRQQS